MTNEQIPNTKEQSKISNFGINLLFVTCSLFIVTCLLFIFSACQNPLSVPKTENIPSGKGSFSLSVNVTRTILPTLDESKLAQYTLVFEPKSGGTKNETERSLDRLSDPVFLEPGTYSLVVTAYFDTGKTKLAARGTLDSVMISEGKSVAGTVTLKAITDSGTGSFTYTVIFPNVKTATMNITPLKAASQGQDHSLSSGNTGTLALDSGYYNLVFTLNKNNGDTLIWRELLHVYAGLESFFSMEFSDADFYKTMYVVTFNLNDTESPNPGTQTVLHGGHASDPAPTREGYAFGGWYSDSDFSTAYDFDTLVFSDITLYAKWIANEYTITYRDVGGGEFSGTHGSGNPTTHTYGTATNLVSPTKTGYTFGGWFENSNGTGTALTVLTATGYTANITLYAKWNPISYSITYRDVGNAAFSGTTNTSPTTHTYGTATNLVNPTKTGYTGAWYTTSDGTGNPVTSIGATERTADFTLYAKWTANEYTITYRDVGNVAFSGTGNTSPTTHTYGTATTLVNPTKTGYTFGGWFENSGGTGTALTVLTATGYTANITLYAKWNIIPVTSVTLDKTTLDLIVGETETLTATVLPTGATNKNVSWSTSTPGRAAVSNGTVTALSIGSATITVRTSDGDHTATCTVTVTALYDPNDPDFPGEAISGIFNVYNEDDWNTAKSTITGGGRDRNYIINVMDDFDVQGSTSASFSSILASIKVSLRGVGRILTLNSNGNLINVSTNQTVILRGPTLQGYSGNRYPLVNVGGSGSAFVMHSGEISGNTTTTGNGGGGVYIQDGSFTMNNGTISDNTATQGGGGGVYVYSGRFTMNGGTISGNTVNGTATNGGGGVFVYSGRFTMNGGTISGNTATQSGGGVYVFGTFRLVTGTIYGSGEAVGLKNTANQGAALYVTTDATAATYGPGDGTGTNLSSTNNTIKVENGEIVP
jgi:uncharacterized repeat protein (TIGR02543 family)